MAAPAQSLAKFDFSPQALERPARSMATIQALFSHPSTLARIGAVIPRHLTAERMTKVLVSSIAKTPKLLECSQMSLLQSAIAMSELGLEPDAVRGLAYLVPYKTTCQLIIGYRGYIELARRSGTLRQVEARIVYERDKLDVRFGLEPKFEHVPHLEGDAGKPRLVYGIARFTDGGEHIEVMTLAQVEEVRKRSRAANSGPWVTDYEEMAKKTLMRRLAKWLPLSPELSKAIEVDDQQFEGGSSRAPEVPFVLESVAPHDAVTGEVIEGESSPAPAEAPVQSEPEDELAKEVRLLGEGIAGASSLVDLRKLAQRIGALPEDVRGGLSSAYDARASSLKEAKP